MVKINLQAVEVLQMDGTMKPEDMREAVCTPLYRHKEKDFVMFALRLYKGECELNEEEEKTIREIIAPWAWIYRDAIEKQLAAK